MRLSTKLPLAAAVLTVVSIAVSSLAGIVVSSNSLDTTYRQKLAAIADGRRNQLETYLEATRKDVEELAATDTAAAALNLFKIGLSMGKDGKEAEMTALIMDKSKTFEEKMELGRESGATVFLNHQNRFSTFFQKLNKENLFEDIYLINADGQVVYTHAMKSDFNVNMNDDEWKNSTLSRVFNKTMAHGTAEGVVFSDYQPYEINPRPLTAYLGKPILVEEEVRGVFLVELPTGKIDQILANTTGLGETGETLLLRSDGMLLSDSVHTTIYDVAESQIDPTLFSGLTGRDVADAQFDGYRDMHSVASFAKVDFLGSNWVIAALVDDAEAHQAIASMRLIIGAIALVLLAVALASALWFSRTLTKPILALVEGMRELSNGRTDIEFENANRTDEIGEMVRSVVGFQDAAIEKLRLEEESEENRTISEQQRADQEAAKLTEANNMKEAVDALADGLTRLSNGDLTVKLEKPFMESLDRLRLDFNSSVEKLNATMLRVSGNATSIDRNAAEMRNATDDLSRRTEQQAASLEETSAALDQITSTVKETSERAAEAAEVANAAKSDTDRSSTVVTDAVSAMEGIERASSEISNIINVIDEIAFQTNLLALNAGVEAARAGEAGKGFAVVAQEVRELAQRAANAAKEIKGLITKSGEEVANGVELVKATGDALGQISQHVTDINSMINKIATAAGEQLSGIQEVNSAVNQMDQVTQQNAAMVQQTNEITHRMADESTDLSSGINQFSMSGEPPVRAKTVPRTPSAPTPASQNSSSVPSPARQIVNKVTSAFSPKKVAAAAAPAAVPSVAPAANDDGWDEF